jgi:predicted ester cyclase
MHATNERGWIVSVEENKAKARRLQEEAVGKGNVEVFRELVAPHFVDRNWPVPAMPEDAIGLFGRMLAMSRAAMPDLDLTVDLVFGEGDLVCLRFHWEGTHTGAVPTFPPPTGKRITQNGIAIYRFEDGKVVEMWHNQADLQLMQQFGVVPTQLTMRSELESKAGP